MSNVENSEEHPAARRMREKFEAQYGAESTVMRAILHWRNVVADFHRPYNSDMETPVTNADMEAAELEMLAEIRRYGVQKQMSVVTDEMADAGYDAMRDPKTNLPAPWIVLGTAFKVFEVMLQAAPKELPPILGKVPDGYIDDILTCASQFSAALKTNDKDKIKGNSSWMNELILKGAAEASKGS